ncbi:septal ring lytic transglycosylase RlpA family protein [Mitsuaria sp. GD03876]|uniref:septal ring lytic transglycosylase RlpA family protein n=1 Tax=Mitsuaria sp. GD03876 TaxID=2975399 RepID=UPI0024498586|nr:septal ring lytic transglycosylase RlpA family protein [Mitsuaria sp. GD03876]MDH0862932.1 septal ring lytic transglycosylase RlpA family protein [Mitsuaria sp. GD03876]
MFEARPAGQRLAVLTCALILAACASRGPAPSRSPSGGPKVSSWPDKDGPDAVIPPDLKKVPDAVPKLESIRKGGPNKPYEVLGERYEPIAEDRPLVQKGLASWYGRKFHGKPTSSGEIYNMYAMTAAHATIPIPSYARVRNPRNGREVIVRINDRGPFHKGRIIDLSYTAALKLDVLNGVAPVEIERITYEDIRTGAWTRDRDTLSPDPKVAPDTPVYAAATPSGAPDLTTTAQLRPPVVPVAAQVPVPTPVIVPAPVARNDRSADRPAAPPASTPAATAPTATAAADGALKPIPITALPPGSDLPPPGQSKADAMATATAGAIAAADPAAPVPALKIAAAQGFWLQFGAFSRLEGAEQLREQFTRGMEEFAPMLTIFKDKNLHRLQAGPFTSREDARAAADRVRSAMALTPILVERR